MGQQQLADVIEVTGWDSTDRQIGDEARVNILVRFFRALNRKMKRAWLFAKHKTLMQWYRLPPMLRKMLVFSAAFCGYFAAWMLFYASVLIAFSYGFVTGFAVLAIWGLLLGYVIAAADNRHQFV